MSYIHSSEHNPKGKIYVILGISPKSNHDTPFAELDALCTHIFMSVEDTLLVKLLLLFHAKRVREHTTPSMVEKLLSLEHDADLRSVNSTDEPDAPLKFLHASLLLDQARSGGLLVDMRLTHET